MRRAIFPAAVLALFAACVSTDHLAPTFDQMGQLGTLSQPSGLVSIVEIHYDNSGADVGEAVEIEGPAGLDLSGWRVVLYNGNGGVTYGTLALSGPLADQCAGRGTVVVAAPGLQNGSPDGLALVNGTTVVEFLSYEGAFPATNGPANGMTSVDIGVAENGEAIGNSLQKDAAGWYGPTSSSFGACNVRPASKISFTGRFAGDPPLPVGFEDQLFATLLDASGNAVPTSIAWAAETPDIAGVDQNGVIHAFAAGSALFRATAGDGTTGTWTLPTRTVSVVSWWLRISWAWPTPSGSTTSSTLPRNFSARPTSRLS